jgi:hypothetical protein
VGCDDGNRVQQDRSRQIRQFQQLISGTVSFPADGSGYGPAYPVDA